MLTSRWRVSVTEAPAIGRRLPPRAFGRSEESQVRGSRDHELSKPVGEQIARGLGH